MPAPADIQTANGGSVPGRAEPDDAVTFTFAAPILPAAILAGWDGSPTAVTVRFDHQGAVSSFTVASSAGVSLTGLGSVDLAAHYTNQVDFTGSTMSASGSVLTVVLGTPGTGGLHTISSPTTMVWTAPSGSAPESGAADAEF